MSKTYVANVDSLAIGTAKEFEILHWHAAIKRLPTPGLGSRDLVRDAIDGKSSLHKSIFM